MRPAVDKRPTERATLLIVEFNLQTTVRLVPPQAARGALGQYLVSALAFSCCPVHLAKWRGGLLMVCLPGDTLSSLRAASFAF
jgi:hypothetical protein